VGITKVHKAKLTFSFSMSLAIVSLDWPYMISY